MAKEHGKAIMCMANLRTFGPVLMMYINDNDGMTHNSPNGDSFTGPNVNDRVINWVMRFIYKHNLKAHAGICAVIILLFNLTAFGRPGKLNWNQFRGPNGQGVAQEDRIPDPCGPDSNVLSKTAISAGQSSPVI